MKGLIIGLTAVTVVLFWIVYKTKSPLYAAPSGPDSGIYPYTLNRIDGQPMPLSQFKGKVVLIVNVASRCGFTSQYSDLEALYDAYKTKGLVVIGIPANNFANQEPGSNDDIQTFCKTTYGVSFPMSEKVSVKGPDIHPLYRYLTQQTVNTSVRGEVNWNFNKFLIGKDGRVVARYASMQNPNAKKIRTAIEALL